MSIHKRYNKKKYTRKNKLKKKILSKKRHTRKKMMGGSSTVDNYNMTPEEIWIKTSIQLDPSSPIMLKFIGLSKGVLDNKSSQSILKTRVIKLLQKKPLFLNYAHNTWKKDKYVVEAVVKQNGLALEYADDVLKNNKNNIVLPAIKQNGLALQYASEVLKADEELVMTAIKQNGEALQYASEVLKADEKLVKTAIKQNWKAVMYASEDLKEDNDVKQLLLRIAGVPTRLSNRTRTKTRTRIK